MMGYITNSFYRMKSLPKLSKDSLTKKIWGMEKDLSKLSFHSVYLFYITKMVKKYDEEGNLLSEDITERFVKLGRTADLKKTTARIESHFNSYDGYTVNCLYWGMDNNPTRKWVIWHCDIIERRVNETLQFNGYSLAKIPRKFPKELFRLAEDQSEITCKDFVKKLVDMLDTSKEIKNFGQLARKDFKFITDEKI